MFSRWVVVLSVVFAVSPAWADSPLTTPDFALAYGEEPAVAMALEFGPGDRVFAALSDPEIAHDTRAAMINALGWSISGAERGAAYLEFVAARHETTVEALTLDALSAQEAFSLGYLLAMDDIHVRGPAGGEGEVATAPASALLEVARQKAPEDFAVALVASLVSAQGFQGESWCKVFTTVNTTVEAFPAGNRNLRPEALDIIMEYIVLYEPECRNPRPVKGP